MDQRPFYNRAGKIRLFQAGRMMTREKRRLVAGGTLFLALGLLFVGGCGDVDDDRPPGQKTGQNKDEDEEDSGIAPYLFIGGPIVFLAIGLGVLAMFAKKTRPGGGAHEGLLYYRCTECKKKISYSRRRIGQQVPCPACGAKFTFPAPSKEAAKGPGKTAVKNPARKAEEE
jgi:DNA-directed RNA polymerase subunit RPC12/RpoP